MIQFEKNIGKSEAKSQYLNITDDIGRTYGTRFPKEGKLLWILTEGRRYKAVKHHNNQIWGLKTWYVHENVHAGDTVCIKYDLLSADEEGRTLIEISIKKRTQATMQPSVVSYEDEKEEVPEYAAQINVKMEQDLEDFLACNLNLVEDGLELYTETEGRDGRQYPTDVGTIDLLCKNGEDFVVLELKKGRGSDAVVGQTSRYIGWIKENLSENQHVRGIIIVHDYEPKLKYAVLAHDNLQLKYYQIEIKFISEQEVMSKLETEALD